VAVGSSIEWTDATWNPVAGCTAVSAGCSNCYAARMAYRLSHLQNAIGEKYQGTAKRNRHGKLVFTGRITLDYDALQLPRSWRLPRLIFVNSMSDVFHEDVPRKFIRKIFEVMEACPHHTFQMLTKRPQRAAEMSGSLPWPSNVWLGTSVEDQRVVERIDWLRHVPATVRFLSCEPLIGPLHPLDLRQVHWVIVGGESGPGARPMLHSWVAKIRDQCVRQHVPFFFKQWGGVHKKRAGRLLDGRTWDSMPSVTSQGVRDDRVASTGR
jgi:protein gp37